jgi:hypothetical protein
MKTFGYPYILQSNTVTPLEALHFGLNSPASVVITGSTLQQSSNRHSRPCKASGPWMTGSRWPRFSRKRKKPP